PKPAAAPVFRFQYPQGPLASSRDDFATLTHGRQFQGDRIVVGRRSLGAGGSRNKDDTQGCNDDDCFQPPREKRATRSPATVTIAPSFDWVVVRGCTASSSVVLRRAEVLHFGIF